MILYSVPVSSATLSTSADVITLTAGATRSIAVWEIDFTGMGVASAANEVVMFGVTTLGVTPTAITPTPMSASSPASSFTAASAFATPPVVNTARYHNVPVNANGSRYFWRAANVFDCIPIPGGALAASQRSFRSVSGTSVVSGRVRVIEV
jgi:hypothetical protein